MINKWQVTKEHSGLRLQAFLKIQLGETVPVKQIKRSIDSGRCLLNGKPERFGSRLVGLGDLVEFGPIPQTGSIQKAEKILYSDDALIAYYKPSGISSDHPHLLAGLQRQYSSLILLHRLDKDTTGILLFARTGEIAKNMEALFKKRQIKKTYLAIVSGLPAQSSGVMENFLGKLHTYDGQAIWGEVPREKGLPAKTIWEVKQRGIGSALVVCYPQTGRTHQIRAHLSEMGFPILGDHQYGYAGGREYSPPRILLHAAALDFEHPVKHRMVTIKAPIPEDFIEAMKHLAIDFKDDGKNSFS